MYKPSLADIASALNHVLDREASYNELMMLRDNRDRILAALRRDEEHETQRKQLMEYAVSRADSQNAAERDQQKRWGLEAPVNSICGIQGCLNLRQHDHESLTVHDDNEAGERDE